MFSSLMSDILSGLSPCLTQEVEILLPDHDIQTVGLLVELLTSGVTTHTAQDVTKIESLANVLGIKMDNIDRESNDDQGEKENRRKLIGPSRNNGDKTKLDGEVATTKIKRESVETTASEEDMSKIVASEGEIKYHS